MSFDLKNANFQAPLVVLVLVYNAIFAPLILHEILRPLDVVGKIEQRHIVELNQRNGGYGCWSGSYSGIWP